MRYTKQQHEEAKKMLMHLMPKGSRVFFVIRKRSRTGMNQRIDFYHISNAEPEMHQFSAYLTAYIAKFLGYATPGEKDGLLTDQGAEVLIHELARMLYGDSYALTYERL